MYLLSVYVPRMLPVIVLDRDGACLGFHVHVAAGSLASTELMPITRLAIVTDGMNRPCA